MLEIYIAEIAEAACGLGGLWILGRPRMISATPWLSRSEKQFSDRSSAVSCRRTIPAGWSRKRRRSSGRADANCPASRLSSAVSLSHACSN